MLEYEREQWARGIRGLAGVDEAGRGPLAGPVVAAAVVMPRDLALAGEHGRFAGLTDSKKLSPAARSRYFALLQDDPAIAVGVGICEAAEIDRINILKATHRAMAGALGALTPPPEFALVDGLAVPGLPCASLALVKGDGLSLLIAAASIIAKVTRDRLMDAFDRMYPEYHFAVNKGYGTPNHMRALLEHGPCPIHRRSFRPVRESETILRLALEEGVRR